MPPSAILDIGTLDLSRIVADREAIRGANPQRFEFELLDAVVLCERGQEAVVFAGYKDIRPDEWWTRGHIPGRPLYPGVLMIESAAQLSSWVFRQYVPDAGFLGFAGVEGVKFRGGVEPPTRLVIVGRTRDIRPRRFIADVQGFVGPTMVFEAVITGMPI
jgi:3-hydroxyacyl-[acyl-carrier-protein] dehydratase